MINLTGGHKLKSVVTFVTTPCTTSTTETKIFNFPSNTAIWIILSSRSLQVGKSDIVLGEIGYLPVNSHIVPTPSHHSIHTSSPFNLPLTGSLRQHSALLTPVFPP